MAFRLLVLALVLIGCSGGSARPAAEHGAHSAHAGHHGGHDHSSPEALRPLMRDLRGWMGDLRATLSAGQVQESVGHARAIAVACDDQEVHGLDPARFGPRFGEIDEQLHSAAAQMATAADGGDLADARARYSALLQSCVSCHAQAPTAGHVDLSDLAVESWPDP